MKIPVLSLLLALGLGPGTLGQDTRQLADALVRQVRATQNEDGTYGADLLTTCRVLDLLTRSPRRYNELDGPFFRRAAEALAAAPQDQGLVFDAWRTLALAGCVTPPLRDARDAARERVAAHPEAARDPTALRALRAVPGSAFSFPAPSADMDGLMQVLVSPEPGQVAAPDPGDVQAWAQWARAARLRGVRPSLWPPLPSPRRDAALELLLDDLDVVLAVHGLDRGPPAGALADAPPLPEVVPAPWPREQALERALSWFDAKQDGGTFGLDLPGWEGPEPGITAMALAATLATARELERPAPAWVDAGLDYLVSLQKPSGAIYAYGVAVYTTSVAIEALLAGGRVQDRAVVDRALQFLIVAQADEGEYYRPSDDPHYGGIGYGGDERPDLSNTQMAIEAAWRAGLPDDHPFYRKALLFLERNQNLGELAAREWPRPGGGKLVSGTDGGATYMPGNSPAGEDQLGDDVYSARSYGSMTYALTKSYLLCGLEPDDVRVEAAVNWLADHYTLEVNPGFADPAAAGDGLYYYYLALGRTLSQLPQERLAQTGPLAHWRGDLDLTLREHQRVDGTWINENSPRWYEGSPTLCTAYALLALNATRLPPNDS